MYSLKEKTKQPYECLLDHSFTGLCWNIYMKIRREICNTHFFPIHTEQNHAKPSTLGLPPNQTYVIYLSNATGPLRQVSVSKLKTSKKRKKIQLYNVTLAWLIPINKKICLLSRMDKEILKEETLSLNRWLDMYKYCSWTKEVELRELEKNMKNEEANSLQKKCFYIKQSLNQKYKFIPQPTDPILWILIRCFLPIIVKSCKMSYKNLLLHGQESTLDADSPLLLREKWILPLRILTLP